VAPGAKKGQANRRDDALGGGKGASKWRFVACDLSFDASKQEKVHAI
jgi:hypothetical protein